VLAFDSCTLVTRCTGRSRTDTASNGRLKYRYGPDVQTLGRRASGAFFVGSGQAQVLADRHRVPQVAYGLELMAKVSGWHQIQGLRRWLLLWTALRRHVVMLAYITSPGARVVRPVVLADLVAVVVLGMTRSWPS
jgi:hypothetical protein